MRSPKRRFLAALCAVLLAVTGLAAEAPVLVAMPKQARSKVVEVALSYAGAPYLSGGVDERGFDCSGFVYRVFYQSVGASLPRTASAQYAFREPVDFAKLQPGDLLFFNTTGSISHVGIYEGDGRFVHAASEGPRRGVIESSLSESYWAKTFVAAGRILPPAEYLGLMFTASLGPSFGTEDFLRGARGSFGLGYKLLGVEAALELRPEYDATLGDFRLPAVFSLGFDNSLKLFAGPALTLGSPSLNGGGRAYEAEGGWLATAGIEFSPIRFRAASLDWGISGEIVYNRYVPASSSDDPLADAAACIRAGVGLTARWGI
jgi:Cell wall-associated hydrolases (invasion-associated proteins)